MNICIVSPDVVGPVKNGGIGTHCYYLADFLAKSGFNVTLLFTGPLECKSHKYWKDFYSDLGIDYISLDSIKANDKFFSNDSLFLENSYYIFNYLKDKKFDFIHFQEWLANGLVTIQAKQTTSCFENTILTVTMHSSAQWQLEGMKLYSRKPILDMKLNWAERYCVQFCDVVISPSEYMFQWAKNSNWELSPRSIVLPYCFDNKGFKYKAAKFNKEHLIFFGRLETRKGLEFFVDNIDGIKGVKKISFLGKISTAGNNSADVYLSKKLKNIEYKIYDSLDSFKAIEFIKKHEGLVVIPSLMDNFPFTIIEMIEYGVPFVCSNVGGIPEQADSKVIFDITDRNSLAKLINSLDSHSFDSIKHKYNAPSSLSKWKNFHFSFIKHSSELKTNIVQSEPLVSICVPYFNYPKYIPLLLASIKKITYRNFEVIVVNDGSPQQEALDVFEIMKIQYPDFKFYSKDNGGVGDTRNYAASKATGEYIIFMDSDNVAYPNMVEDFVKAISKSNSDVVTCYFDAFNENFEECNPENVLFKYLPLGACREAGILENIYGDANFIVKKQVFDEVGGFGTERHTSWEDWEFLAKCALEGYSQRVVPKSLFGYRHTEMGFSRNTSLYDNHQRILKCYSKYYPVEIQRLFSGYVLPTFYHVSISKRIYLKFKNRIGFFFPENSKRREFLKLMIKRILK